MVDEIHLIAAAGRLEFGEVGIHVGLSSGSSAVEVAAFDVGGR